MIRLRSRVLRMALIAAAVVAGTSGVVHATTITYESYFTFQTESYTNESLIFPQFDVPDATLNSVTLTFEPTGTVFTSQHTEVTTSGFLQNTGESASTGLDIGSTAHFTITGSYFTGINFNLVSDILDYSTDDPNYLGGSLAGYSGTPYSCSSPYTSCPAPGSDTITWNGVTTMVGAGGGLSVGNSSQTLTTGLASFVGSGSITVNGINATGNLTGTLPNSFTQNALTQSEAVVDITYDYSLTGAPEPATYGLFSSALAGLILFRKKLAR